MELSRAELIIHPVRLRILQQLSGQTLTTAELSTTLPDVPTSSIYRHLRLLLEGGVIGIVETRQVSGIQEKVYGMAQSAHLRAEELKDVSVDEHLRFFTTWLLSVLQGFAGYLERTEAGGGAPDFLADSVGYSEVVFPATDSEMDAFSRALNEAILPFLRNTPGEGRRKRKLATILHPLD